MTTTNADTLDGIDSSQFLRSDAGDTASGRISFTANNDVLESASGSLGSIEIYQNNAGADAFMAFHVAGDFAAYFGLKGDINDFAVGGWSMGATYYRIWHQGNDGAGSGLDADLLDGYNSATGATANTIALRDGSGHLTMNYGFSSYLNMSHSVGTRSSDTIFYSSTDNYIRKTNSTGMRASLNVPTRTGGDASGTWGINITGSAARLSDWSRKTANYTAVNGNRLIADTSGGTFTLTLPSSPSTGHSVVIADGADWTITNLTVGRNGSTIEGLAENLTVDVGQIQVELIYDGTTWEVYASAGGGGGGGGFSAINYIFN